MITFAGVPVLLEDVQGDLADFLSRYLPAACSDVFATPPHAGLVGIGGPGNKDYVIPTPNWPDPPIGAQFNTLYWPTGATRWAHCFLLVDGERMSAIWDQINLRDVTHAPADLVFSEEGDRTSEIVAEMYLLPPRKVPVEGDLWILPLVDQRYYWQYRKVPFIASFKSWTEMFQAILDDLDVTYALTDIAQAYEDQLRNQLGEPNLHWVDKRLPPEIADHNVAVFLDAMAFTVGRRIVITPAGTLSVQTAEEAEDRYLINLDAPFNLIAGGEVFDIRGAVPEKLDLVFRGTGGEFDLHDVYERDAADNGHPAYTQNVSHTVFVPHPGDSQKDDDDRDTHRENFADAFAADWFGWLKRHYEYSYGGIKTWSPSGFDDCVIWNLGSQRAPGDYEANTRVRTLAYNYSPATLLSIEPPEFQVRFFELAEDLGECGVPGAADDDGNSLGATAKAWELEIPSEPPVGPAYWKRKNPEPEGVPESTVVSWHEWRGMAFGVVAAGQAEGVDQWEDTPRGEIVQAVEFNGTLIVLGTGHTVLFCTTKDDANDGDTLTAEIGFIHEGDCGTNLIAGRELEVVATEDVRKGDLLIAVWSNQEWYGTKVNPIEPGCGLKIETDQDSANYGKLVVVPEDIAGCGLKPTPRAFENEVCSIDVDNEVLAGPHLKPFGECSLQVDPALIDRIEELEECCERLTDIITILIECCEESRECCYESMLCCYENQECCDYVGTYCCDDPPPGANDCDSVCVWKWTGTKWVNIVPCAGPVDCDCDAPTHNGTQAGDLAFTDCESGGGGGSGATPCCDCSGKTVNVALSAPCLEIDDNQNALCTGSNITAGGFQSAVTCTPPATVGLTVRCDETRDAMVLDWTVDALPLCNASGTVDAEDVQCDPVSMTFKFTVPAECCCAPGSPIATVTVTEVV